MQVIQHDPYAGLRQGLLMAVQGWDRNHRKNQLLQQFPEDQRQRLAGLDLDALQKIAIQQATPTPYNYQYVRNGNQLGRFNRTTGQLEPMGPANSQPVINLDQIGDLLDLHKKNRVVNPDTGEHSVINPELDKFLRKQLQSALSRKPPGPTPTQSPQRDLLSIGRQFLNMPGMASPGGWAPGFADPQQQPVPQQRPSIPINPAPPVDTSQFLATPRPIGDIVRPYSGPRREDLIKKLTPRQSIARAMGRLKDKESRQELKQILAENDPEKIKAAYEIMVKNGIIR